MFVEEMPHSGWAGKGTKSSLVKLDHDGRNRSWAPLRDPRAPPAYVSGHCKNQVGGTTETPW